MYLEKNNHKLLKSAKTAKADSSHLCKKPGGPVPVHPFFYPLVFLISIFSQPLLDFSATGCILSMQPIALITKMKGFSACFRENSNFIRVGQTFFANASKTKFIPTALPSAANMRQPKIPWNSKNVLN